LHNHWQNLASMENVDTEDNVATAVGMPCLLRRRRKISSRRIPPTFCPHDNTVSECSHSWPTTAATTGSTWRVQRFGAHIPKTPASAYLAYLCVFSCNRRCSDCINFCCFPDEGSQQKGSTYQPRNACRATRTEHQITI